jgi:hypothetical protein
MSIALLLNSPQIRGKVTTILDNTSAFLLDPNKEARLKREGKTPDPKVLGQYVIPDEYGPMRMSDDFDVLQYLIERNMAIASVIATGQAIPQTRAGRIIKLEGSEFGKIGISHVWGEKDQIRMMKLRQANNIPREFLDLLLGTVESLQPRIVKTANVLWWQVITSGLCDFTDPRSGDRFRLEYSAKEPSLFPAPLTGNATGTAVWNDYTNANGIDNLQKHARAFYDINGFYPDETGMSQDLLDDLLRQQSTRNYALSLGIINNIPGAVNAMVSESILGKIFSELKIPKLRVTDAQYEIEIAPGQNVRGRYLPTDTYVFLTKGMSERLFSPTIEGKGKSGIFVQTVPAKDGETTEKSFAVARMIPYVPQPKFLASRKVK